MESILQRIKQLADNETIKITALEAKIGASKGVLSRAFKNNTDIQSKWLSNIVENYPLYNSDWLLTGKGEMLKSDDAIPLAVKSNHYDIGLPLIPLDAMAGIASGEISIIELECERYIIPMFKGADYLIPVKGSSMYPKYSSGDVVACKKVPLQDVFFQWNKVYVLDTNQGVIIKRIHKSELDGFIKIVSENPKYEPFDLNVQHIYAISIVIGVVRLE